MRATYGLVLFAGLGACSPDETGPSKDAAGAGGTASDLAGRGASGAHAEGGAFTAGGMGAESGAVAASGTIVGGAGTGAAGRVDGSGGDGGMSPRTPAPRALDKLIFGDAASEAQHSLASAFPRVTDTTKVKWEANTPSPTEPSATAASDVVTGGLGSSARRLLPRTPNGDVYGGQVTFTMTVDPVKQNYFTLKMWGGDNANGFLLLNVEGKEIGARHGSAGLDEDPLYFGGPNWYHGRFFYRTEPLPLYLTRGKTSATLTIRSLGSMFFYAPIFTYVPQYQHVMNSPSFGLYVGYTHTGAMQDVSDEAQGSAPAVRTPRTNESEAAALSGVKSQINSSLANKLNAAASSLGPGDIQFLARCYDAKENQGQAFITYPSGKTAANLIAQVIGAVDAQVTAQSANGNYVGQNWGGSFGPMGDGIRIVWPQINTGTTLDTVVAYGGSYGSVSRKVGWAKALRASVDSGRFGRQNIGAQSMYNATNIYYANRGLLVVDSAQALAETEAIRYAKEAWGVLPWLGDDQKKGGTDGVGGGPVPTRGPAPFGPNWYMCTSKGTSKDGNGFTGSDYGEVASYGYHLAYDAGDAQLAQRTLLMARARARFRYPGVDEKGFAMMMGTDPIGVRNNDLPSHYAYLGRTTPDDFLLASRGASVIGNDLLGYFQQQVNDGQAYRYFSGTYEVGNGAYDPYFPSLWAALKAMPQTGIKLPTTAGEPDSAWVDEENMVVAAKHGEERFYANLFWRQPNFVNGLAKVFLLTPESARLADAIVDDVRFRSSGGSVTTVTKVDYFADPPDNPVAAYGGLMFATALRSDLSSVPAENRDAGRGSGYTFRYGHWLVGIDADYTAPYTVQTPPSFTSAVDLITGAKVSGPVILKPKTSVVFYLDSSFEDAGLPSRSLFLRAVAASGSIALNWNDASGATSYEVLRSSTSGGPYQSVSTDVKNNSATDQAVTSGATYYYVVASANQAGKSGYSPEAKVTAK